MSFFEPFHLEFKESIARFSSSEILPHLDKWEEDRWFPTELFEKLAAQGYLGIMLPEELGGIGGDFKLAAAWIEEMGKIPSLGLTTAIHMHNLIITPTLARLGTESAKSKWIESSISGKAVSAYAFTEPGAGSDLSSIKTSARKNGDHYVINGSKTFITNGARADWILVLTKTDPSKGYEGMSTFVVDTKSKGFSVTRKLDKLGWHCSDTAELHFQDVEVSSDCLLGKEGEGWKQAMGSLEWERLMLSLNSIVGAKQCLTETVRYTIDRSAFKNRIIDFDNTKELLAGYWARLQSAHALCYHCIDLLQNKQKCRKEVSMVKLFATELAIDCANTCLQLHGGYGFTTEFKPERWLRELRLNTLGGGTSEIMARTVAKDLLS